ncbi:MAG: TonB family protein [Brumimicrobium sp.]|nr:TonB family protein [Brumimicrobium sp.]
MEKKKNPEVDNEKVKLPLIFLGFFVVASIITLSFSYETPVSADTIDRGDRDKSKIPTEVMEIEQPEDEPVVQDLPEPEMDPPPTDEIKVEENKDEDEPVKVETPPIVIEPDPEPEPEAPIVDYPDKEASFPGGAAALKQYLSENIKYPEIAIELQDQGKVFVEFVVDRDGSISQIKILRGVSKEIDQEAKRVVRSMPKWEPGEARGEAVKTRCRIPINFTLR